MAQEHAGKPNMAKDHGHRGTSGDTGHRFPSQLEIRNPYHQTMPRLTDFSDITHSHTVSRAAGAGSIRALIECERVDLGIIMSG